jgi:aminoglycoside phosphotransferase (APT) family kinase protein
MSTPHRASVSEIESLIQAHGYTAGAVKPVPGGHFNESYYVRTTAGPDLVVRIAPPGDAGLLFYERGMMAQEPEIHDIVRRRTDLPVPEIVAFDDTHRILDRDAIIMERLPGRSLAYTRLTREAMDSLMRDIGAALAQLHRSCHARQYGYLGAHAPMLPADRWSDAFMDMWDRLMGDLEGCGVFLPEHADEARRAIEHNLNAFDYAGPARLLHMDIWTQNILVDHEGTLCGIIDWDRALWGDPGMEFAVLAYCGFDNEAFWQGYGASPNDSARSWPEAAVRSRFYHLYEVLKYPVIWTLRGGRSNRIASYRDYGLSIIKELL